MPRAHSQSVVAALVAVLSVTSCSAQLAGSPAPPWKRQLTSAAATTTPRLGNFLHPNYTVVAESKIAAQSTSVPDVVVSSSGPGLDPSRPVQGGTQDVQILRWDALAKQWAQIFDAATDVVTPEILDSGNSASVTPSVAQPLLDQTHPVSGVWTRQVDMAKNHPLLIVYGIDAATNHPPGIVGLVSVPTQGTPEVTYYSIRAGMFRPTIEGRPGQQRVTLRAEYFTDADAECCPVRDFTQTLGPDPVNFALTSAVQVVQDNRPWMGADVTTDPTTPGAVIVVGTAPGSPASASLRVLDHIVGVETPPSSSSGKTPGVLDDVGRRHPGDHITLSVTRAGRDLRIPVTLSSLIDTSSTQSTVPQPAIIGVSAADAPVGQPAGAVINTVLDGGPAATAGLQAGQTITAAGPVPVQNAQDLQVALVGTAGQTINLTVRTPDDLTGTIAVTPTPPAASDYNVLQVSAF